MNPGAKKNNERGERREGVLPRPPRPAPFGSTTRSPIRCSCLCLSRAPGKKSKVPSSPVPRPLERPSFALTTPTYAAHTPSFFSSSAPPFDRRAPAGEEVRQARGQGQDQGEQLQKVKVNKNGKCAAVTYLDHTRGIERPHRCSSPDCGPCLLHPAAGLFCPGGLPRSLDPEGGGNFPSLSCLIMLASVRHTSS